MMWLHFRKVIFFISFVEDFVVVVDDDDDDDCIDDYVIPYSDQASSSWKFSKWKIQLNPNE